VRVGYGEELKGDKKRTTSGHKLNESWKGWGERVDIKTVWGICEAPGVPIKTLKKLKSFPYVSTVIQAAERGVVMDTRT
jgi:RNA polymerase-binding transcription factor DksA